MSSPTHRDSVITQETFNTDPLVSTSGQSTPTNSDITHVADGIDIAEKNLESRPMVSTDDFFRQDEMGRENEIHIKWHADDPEHPFNWPLNERWMYALIAFTFNGCTALNATGYNSAQYAGAHDFHVSPTVWLTGTTCYMVPVAVTPLILAPLSEQYGRRPLYCIAMLVFTAMYIPQALAPNMATVLATRILQGIAGSVGNTMVAGSVADMFPKQQRAIPMGAFVLTVFICQAIGSVASSWTANTVGWRWIFWWQGSASLCSFIAVAAFLPETREMVILAKRAKKLSEATGVSYVISKEKHESFFKVAARNASRPVLFFVTEPIITFMALWIGFLWGTVFLSLNGVSASFAVYGWSLPQRQTVLITIAVGAIFGFASNIHQSRLYDRACKRANGKPAPETRLYWSMPAAVMTVVGLLWYGWSAHAKAFPLVPIIGLIFFSWGTYIIYLATLAYIADSYETYASSGIACQALLRNIFAGTYILFAHPMYRALTPPIATSLLACIAAVLGSAPFVLFLYGHRLREMSRVYKKLRREEELRESSSQ